MKTVEEIDVYIKFDRGRTDCICMRSNKGCNEDCEEDTVTRDLYREWENTFGCNIYGKNTKV